MTQILLGKPVVEKAVLHLQQQVKDLQLSSKFLAILLFGDNKSSDVYVRMKRSFGERIGLPVRVFQEKDLTNGVLSTETITTLIHQLNTDTACCGIILQLPLPAAVFDQTNILYTNVEPFKDVDGLGGKILGLAQLGVIDFLPATAAAVMAMLKHYHLDDVKGKRVALLGQSNLVGKPLANHLMNAGATVHSFNEFSNQEAMRKTCRESDYLISCTGVVHLVDASFVRDDQSQIVIDVGYGHKDGRPVGDVDTQAIVDKVAAVTPVPGGIGPLTVMQLFANTIQLISSGQQL